MIDEKIISVPPTESFDKLPFGDRIVGTACYVYCYHVGEYPFTFEVAAWWQDRQGACHALVYAHGGPGCRSMPDDFELKFLATGKRFTRTSLQCSGADGDMPHSCTG